MLTCFHCNGEHTEAHYARVVHNKTVLYGPWTGWRMAGRFLVAPDRARITPERVRGMMWREELRPKKRSSGKVVAFGPEPPVSINSIGLHAGHARLERGASP